MPSIRSVTFSLLLLAALILAGCGTPDTSGLPDEPVFASKSNDKIKLRYKYIYGQKTDFEMSFEVDATANFNGIKEKQGMHFIMKGYYRVKSVDPLNTATIDMVLTRFIFIMQQGGRRVEFDSDKPVPRHLRPFRSLKAMLHVPIEAKVTELGKVTEVSTRRLEIALSHANAPRQMSRMMVKPFREMGEFSHYSFPEEAVSAGYVIDYGNVTKNMNPGTPVEMHMKLKVAAISADKSKVLLVQLVKPSSSNQNIKELKYVGWALFDVQKGSITRSSVRFSMNGSMNVGGKNIDTEALAKIKYFAD